MNSNNINVLLIDDDEDQYYITKEFLNRIRNHKYILKHIMDFDEAKRYLEKNEFDVYLIDYRLGPDSGVELLHYAVEIKCDAPLIMLTGRGDHEIDLKAMNAGASDYLNKNLLSPELLERSIRYAIEQKNSEKEKQNLLTQLTNKNEELQSIIYAVSHDLRSPMVNIKGFSTVLGEYCRELQSMIAEEQNGVDNTEAINTLVTKNIDEAISFVASSCDRIDNLLKGLLKLSRLTKVEISPVKLNVHKLVSELLDDFKFQVREKNITLSIKDDLPPCIGDELLISQVFDNLISNAVKYLDDKRPGIIIISGLSDTSGITYCIEDNGIGIHKKFYKRIFEVFQRVNVRDDVNGDGLGLSLVKKILERHNGMIYVKSEVDKGSKFFITLPLPQ